MKTKDIADLFISATGKIEFYWHFYTVMLLALIGWLVSTKRDLRPGLRRLIAVGYLAFVLMNILGLWSSYTFAEALRQDLLDAVSRAPGTLRNAQAVLSDKSFVTQRSLALVIHAVLGVFVLSVILFGRLGERMPDAHD